MDMQNYASQRNVFMMQHSISIFSHVLTECTLKLAWEDLILVVFCGFRVGGLFYIKNSSYICRKSHCEEKMISWLSCLHKGISCTSKMTYLYWISALIDIVLFVSVSVYVCDTKRIMYGLEWRTVFALTRGLFLCLFPELHSKKGNKHQNNPRVSEQLWGMHEKSDI